MTVLFIKMNIGDYLTPVTQGMVKYMMVCVSYRALRGDLEEQGVVVHIDTKA